MSLSSPQKNINKAVDNLYKYADRGVWATRQQELFTSQLADIAETLDVSVNDFMQVMHEADLTEMILGYLFEMLTTSHWDGEELSMIDEFLKRQGWREAAYGRRYLMALNESDAALWEVVSVNAGHYIDVRLFGSQSVPLRVHEKSATINIAQWDCLAARVVTLDGKPLFSGALLQFTPQQAQDIVQLIESTRLESVQTLQAWRAEESGEPVTDEQIQSLASAMLADQLPELLLQRWVTDAYHSITGSMPTLLNSDGDELLLSKVKFQISASDLVAIEQGLNNAEELVYDDLNQSWSWLASEGSGQLSKGALLLGSIRLENQYLTLFVNSRQRAEDGTTYLTAQLGALIGQPLTVYENLESAMNTHQTLVPGPSFGVDEIEQLTAYLNQHYQKVLDSPVPILNHKTPRECAQQVDKQPLIQWLKGLENTLQTNMAHYDFKWMWAALGLEYPL